MINIEIGDKKYKVLEARTEEEQEQGLRGIKELPKDEGMLFYIQGHLKQVPFTMEGMEIPLDIIYIDQDDEVFEVNADCQPNQDMILNEPGDVKYVLEVNANSGILEGDELVFEDEQGPVMKVLAQDGSTQMLLFGGERIFSRKNTIVLIKKAKKADKTKDEKDYKALGRYMFKCIKGLDERPAEYVENTSKSDKS